MRKLAYSRNNLSKEQSNKENSADDQAKINYMNRKKQYAKERENSKPNKLSLTKN